MSASIPDSTHIPTHVMISSVMRDREADRETIARAIEELGDIPWYADKSPHEFSNISGETLSFRMAEDCDLYLLIIFPRYGTVFDGDPRSVTHQEFDRARQVNPYKVEVFIAAEAKANPESDALRDFIAEVSDFRDGYSPHIFTSVSELREQVLAALVTWRDGGNTGRNAYVRAVANEYSAFRNPVTGKEMDYGATVQLKLRAKVWADMKRPEWGDEEDSKKSGRRHRREERNRERERVRMEATAASPPQILRELLAQHAHVVVIGDVGSGKSTLLKRMAHDAATDYFRTARARLPILITATRLGRAAIEHPDHSLAVIVGLLQQDDTRYDVLRQAINRTVSEALHRGEALLLVDGLDEASAPEQSAVFGLLAQIGTNLVVWASRPSVYSNQFTGWQIADLQQLGPEQRRELVLQVFRAETSKQEQSPPDERFAKLADSLLADLRGRESDLAAWGGNPLLLTLIAVQYLHEQQLPENRARIYELAIEDLQRERPADAHRYLSERELENYLRLLALKMTEALRRDTTIEEVRDTHLRKYEITTKVAREILERSGVLQRDVPSAPVSASVASSDAVDDDNDNDRYEFVHISFREYLAACAMTDLPETQQHDLARRHSLHQAWEQVMMLLVNRLDLFGSGGKSDNIIREMIKADRQRIVALRATDPTHIALCVATRCALSRGKLLSDDLYRELQNAWWLVWRAEERRLMPFREFFTILDETLGVDAPDHVEQETVLVALREGMPLLLHRVYVHRRLPSSGWWINGILIALIVLSFIYGVAQVTLNIGLLASSAWGHWVGLNAPRAFLVLVIVIVILRLCARLSALSSLRRTMFSVLFRQSQWGQLGERAPIELLVAALDDNDFYIPASAVNALGQLGERAPIPLLVAALKDTRWPVRQAAVQTLAALGDHLPLEMLIDLLHDSIVNVQDTARDVLIRSAEHMPPETLLNMLHASDSTVRFASQKAFGKHGQHVPMEMLLNMLDDSEPSVRIAAAGALGQHGDHASIEVLLEALQDRDPWVRGAVAEALGQLGERAPVEALLSALHDSGLGVRGSAERALERFGKRVPVEPLIEALHDADAWVRCSAARLLGHLGDRTSILPLSQVLDDVNPFVRQAVAQALWNQGEHAPIEPVLTMIMDPDSFVREGAEETLGHLGDQESLEPLIVAMQDKKRKLRVRVAAARALGLLGDRVPAEFFLGALHDFNSDVRIAAVLALASRDLTLRMVRTLYQEVARPRGWRIESPLRLIHWLADWSVLLGIILAQLTLIFPDTVGSIPLPQSVHWIFSLTAWWQSLILALFYAVTYLSAAIARATVYYDYNPRVERVAVFNVLESAIRRRVVDTDSKTLAGNSD